MDEQRHSDNLLARVTGLFGTKGYPEVLVEVKEDDLQRLPLDDESASVVMTARKYLADRNLEPLAP